MSESLKFGDVVLVKRYMQQPRPTHFVADPDTGMLRRLFGPCNEVECARPVRAVVLEWGVDGAGSAISIDGKPMYIAQVRGEHQPVFITEDWIVDDVGGGDA